MATRRRYSIFLRGTWAILPNLPIRGMWATVLWGRAGELQGN